MRLSEDKIKAAILDNDPRIRLRALDYFTDSYSSDTSVMPLVIKAVETFPKKEAYSLIRYSKDLPQTEETIAWVIDELNKEKTDQFKNYVYHLSMLLLDADPALLLPKESAILESRLFLPELHAPFLERLKMLSWDEATCWQELEAFCEEGKDKQYSNDVNLARAYRIVEALARYGDKCEEKVDALLRQKIEDYRHNPMQWMELLAVRLAGQARLDSTVPLIVTKLIEDADDVLNEQCAEALTCIGTSRVLETIEEAYPGAAYHFRLYGANPLENIHSDLAVAACLRLLRKEQEYYVQMRLAYALLSHFAPEGIEEARQLLLGREFDFETNDLRHCLLETCAIMGERFPEYDEWLAIVEAKREEYRKRTEAIKDDPESLIRYAYERLTGKKAADISRAQPSLPRTPRPTLPRPAASKQKARRNSPCPCGSGKKFKNCCLKNKPGIS